MSWRMRTTQKIITLGTVIVTLGLAGLVLSSGDSSALTYQSNVGVNFTFNPSISVSVSDNLVINNLTPGDSSDSNIITVGVSTNSVAGYTLSATVGNKTDASTALTNTSNSSYTFTNLATTPGVAANLSAFGDNKWGYSYCKDTVTNCGSGGSATWISGSVGADGAAGSSVAGYAGLPLDNNDNVDERGMGGVTLINTTSAADSDSVQFKIGAKAGSTQPAGTYANVINFYAVSYAPPVTLYDAYYAAGKTMLNGYYRIQDLDDTICGNVDVLEEPLDVIDVRDGEVYKIAKLADEKCWTLDNLRLDLSNSTTLNGLSTTNTNATAQALECLKTGTYGGNACTSPYATAAVVNKTSSFSSYNLPYVNVNYKDNIAPVTYGVGSGKIGVYYNYCATSAGSYCYASNAGVDVADTYRDIESDICPVGWRLPSGNTNSGTRITDYGTLYSAYASATIGQGAAMRNALSTPLSGYFYSSSQYDLGTYGYFWSSTWGSTTNMYYQNSNSTGAKDGTYPRSDGQSIRCVLGSS